MKSLPRTTTTTQGLVFGERMPRKVGTPAPLPAAIAAADAARKARIAAQLAAKGVRNG